MAQPYSSPGVYVKEVSLLPSVVVRDAATIPLFAGWTRNHTLNFPFMISEGETAAPVLVGSYQEYVRIFGAPKPEQFKVHVEDRTASGSVQRKVQVSREVTVDSDFLMGYAIQHYFANGGGPCKVMSLAAAYKSNAYPISDYWYNGARNNVPMVEGCSLLVLPDAVALGGSHGKVMQDFLSLCETTGNRFLLVDVPYKKGSLTKSDAATSLESFRTLAPGSAARHGAAYFPYLVTTLRYEYDPSKIVVTHTVDGTPGSANQKTVAALKTSGHDGLYNAIIAELDAVPVVLPPSAAVAGQMVRTDRERGVWKAPANVTLNAVQEPNLQLTTLEADTANVDVSGGKSVNVIRSLPGRGTVIWGARTLDGNSPEWRYVPVRRLFTMAETAIKRGSEWAVFEPNDANTWLRLKTMIENYLTGLWREGALMGAKPQEAFYVRVGLGVTMTPQDILEGMLRIEVGMAAVRPAEFIVLRISQMMQQS